MDSLDWPRLHESYDHTDPGHRRSREDRPPSRGTARGSRDRGHRCLSQRGAALLLVGGMLYLVGAIGLTIVYHVPLNDALATVDPNSAEGAGRWAGYLEGWTRWNHVRTAAALAAAAAFTVRLAL
jgi:hypothetical protein